METYPRHGDKQNSAFFEETLVRLCEARDRSGLTQNVGLMAFVMIQVEKSERDRYLTELSLMTAYSYGATYEGFGHLFTVFEVDEMRPAMVVVTDLDEGHDLVEALNRHSVRGRKKPHTRYLGEVFWAEDLDDLEGVLCDQKVSLYEGDFPFLMTYPSEYTWNSVSYLPMLEARGFLRDGFTLVEERPELLARLEAAKAKQEDLGVTPHLGPIDHLATRVFCHDREHAILEYLKLTPYYYWGSFLIADQNSSTNVTRSRHASQEDVSPAKVFTAAEQPYYLDHLTQMPSPTEDFVRYYGRRMHHIAHATEQVDFVVEALKREGVDFLLKVIGSEEEGIKQIFSTASDESYLITEYIERFHGFQGFFTKKNVAFLTKAAAVEYDSLAEKNLCD